jgi:hypothetical protein
MLSGIEEVRFRVNYWAVPSAINKRGIAFDDFAISQRTRLTLLEHFTNANDSATVAADNLVKSIRRQMPEDVIDVQYHTSYPSSDRINTENPIVSSTRGLFYGNTRVPYALLDGGPYDEYLDAERKYDFRSRRPGVEDVHSRSLTPPEFSIDINVAQLAPVMQLQIDLTALEAMAGRELTLYTLVIEDTIDNPDYFGTNDQDMFRNVARKILPDAGGENFSQSWDRGEMKTVPLVWSPIDTWINRGRISIVAFIQDDNTKEILQAATTQEYNPSTGLWDVGVLTAGKVILYPNPAGERINVYFEERPDEDLKLMIYNMSGRLVLTDQVTVGQMIRTIELNQLGDGLYILELRRERNGSLYHRDKFFHH